ncbi:GNAT family N-acetyltransferase [Alteromonas gracilis]|uniref:GNAT family N-acetyltransferase n=1 Tax=Alteromonas gracilis TaxID=1479524 RepID=UPI00373543C7
MALPQLRDWLLAPYSEHHSHSTIHFHRRMLIVSGKDKFCDTTVIDIHKYAAESSDLTVTLFTGDKLKGKNRKKVLGSESDIAILDCRGLFKPGDVMAVSGTVKQGGCLVLICPTLDTWPQNVPVSFVSHGFTLDYSRYLNRFIKRLRNDTNVAFLSEMLNRLPSIQHYKVDNKSQETYRGSLFQSQEQEHAYSQLCQAYSLQKLNAVVTAPRGRGKSSLLGLFIQKLLRDGKRVLLTSELFENVKNVMARIDEHGYADGLATESSGKSNKLSHQARSPQEGFVKWVPPDSELLYNAGSDEKKYDIIIVDEAASIPLPVVSNIITHNSQWILSTTMLGYEGSGSGFLHKLMPRLHNVSLFLELTTPLRWFENDPIETFFNQTCLFETENSDNETSLPALNNAFSENAKPSKQYTNALAEDWSFTISSFEDISESALVQVMSLLSLAHYQTTPDDFMRLMDSADILIATLMSNDRVVCAAVINIEGAKQLEGIAVAIAAGKRRPKGHLGAQRLTLLSANPNAATHQYWRINRIAVNTAIQSRGIGSKLIEKIVFEAYKHNIDGLCTSYGTTRALDNFWARNKFEIVDYGRKPNKASGETSALAVLPLKSKVKSLVADLIALRDSFTSTMTITHLPNIVIDVYDKKLLEFTSATRPLDDVLPILNKIACQAGSTKIKSNVPSASREARKRLLLVAELFNQQLELKEALKCSNKTIEPLFEVLKANGIKDATQLLRNDLKSVYSN